MDQIKELLEMMLIFLLNPITWAIVAVVTICSKRYWKPVIAGVLTQITCITFIFGYMVFIEGQKGSEEVVNETAVGEFAFFLSSLLGVCILSGITISALVFLFARESRLRKHA